MIEIEPLFYDAAARIVHTDEHGGGWREESFIQEAVRRFFFYDERELFAWAVEQGLPGVMESEESRAVLAKLVHDGIKRNRGNKPRLKKKTDARHMEILKRVWHYQAQGLPVYVNRESEADAPDGTACDLAARDCDCSAETALKVWRDAGGHDLEGAFLIGAWCCGVRPKKSK